MIGTTAAVTDRPRLRRPPHHAAEVAAPRRHQRGRQARSGVGRVGRAARGPQAHPAAEAGGRGPAEGCGVSVAGEPAVKMMYPARPRAGRCPLPGAGGGDVPGARAGPPALRPVAGLRRARFRTPEVLARADEGPHERPPRERLPAGPARPGRRRSGQVTDDLPETTTPLTRRSTSLSPHTSPTTCEITMKLPHRPSAATEPHGLGLEIGEPARSWPGRHPPPSVCRAMRQHRPRCTCARLLPCRVAFGKAWRNRVPELPRKADGPVRAEARTGARPRCPGCRD